jgi:hypothetical protein
VIGRTFNCSVSNATVANPMAVFVRSTIGKWGWIAVMGSLRPSAPVAALDRVLRSNAVVRPKKGQGVEIERQMRAEDVIDIDAEILIMKSDEQIICHRRENRGGNRF